MRIAKADFEKFVSLWTSDSVENPMGELSDMTFTTDADWVEGATVIDHIRFHEGKWHVSLVFAHPTASNTFVLRRVSAHPSYESARFNAHAMRRRAATGQRRVPATVEQWQFHKN